MSSKYISVHYSKSARSTCKTCMNKIDKGELRVGEETNVDGRAMSRYFHLDCYKIPLKFTYPNDLDGEDELEEEDRKKVKKYFKDDYNRARSAKWKTQKPPVAKEEIASMALKEKRAAVKEKRMAEFLGKQYQLGDLKQMLETNAQRKSGTKGDLVIRVAEKMLKGNDPGCPKCHTTTLQLKTRKDGTQYWSCASMYDRDGDGVIHRCGFHANYDPETGKAFKPQKKGSSEEDEEDDDIDYSSIHRTEWKDTFPNEKENALKYAKDVDSMDESELDKELYSTKAKVEKKDTKAQGKKSENNEGSALGKRKQATLQNSSNKRARSE